MPQPPVLTPEQREQALAKAAEARRVRAELKEKLKMGAVSSRRSWSRPRRTTTSAR